MLAFTRIETQSETNLGSAVFSYGAFLMLKLLYHGLWSQVLLTGVTVGLFKLTTALLWNTLASLARFSRHIRHVQQKYTYLYKFKLVLIVNSAY